MFACPFVFLFKCLNLQKQGHNITHLCAYCLMCGFSFSFLLKLMALRLVYLPHQHVFPVILMFYFYYNSLCGFQIGLAMLLEIWNECYCKTLFMFLQYPFLFFFFINVGVRANLRAPRLIPRALKLTTM
jgi:hypothetical protein